MDVKINRLVLFISFIHFQWRFYLAYSCAIDNYFPLNIFVAGAGFPISTSKLTLDFFIYCIIFIILVVFPDVTRVTLARRKYTCLSFDTAIHIELGFLFSNILSSLSSHYSGLPAINCSSMHPGLA